VFARAKLLPIIAFSKLRFPQTVSVIIGSQIRAMNYPFILQAIELTKSVNFLETEKIIRTEPQETAFRSKYNDEKHDVALKEISKTQVLRDALPLFKNPQDFKGILQIYPKMTDDLDRFYMQDIVRSTECFTDTNFGRYLQFRLKPEVFNKINEIGVDKFVTQFTSDNTLLKDKILKILPQVYEFLYSKRDADYFTWQDLDNKVQIPDEIGETLYLKLYRDKYIQRSEIYSIEEEDRLEVTDKFKLFYAGFDEEYSSTEIHHHEHYETHGSQSPIAKEMKIKESFNKSGESKEGIKINKKILSWTIIIVLLTATLVILALR